MRLAAIAAALVGLTLDACTSYAPPDRDPDTALQRFEARRLDDPRLLALVANGTPDAAHEWNLDTLARAAVYLSPDLEEARAKWRVSRAAIETAARRPNPSLDASIGRASRAPEGQSASLADVALGIRVETAGKRGHRIAQASALSESDRLDLHAAAWRQRGRVRDAMIEWHAAARESALLERQAEARRAIARMLERRVALGEAAMGEKARADAALASALLDQAGADSRASEARSRLAQAVGVPVTAIAEARITFDSLDSPAALPPEPALMRAGLERDDLGAALARFTAADQAYRLEIARQYPDIEFGPSYSYDTGTNKISIGVMSLTLPLADRNRGPIAEARARRDEAAVRFEALQATVLAALDRAQVAEHEAATRQALALAILERERAQLGASARRFSAGEDDRLSLAQAQAAVYGAEQATLAAALARQKGVGQIEDAARVPLFAAGAAARSAVENGGRP